MDDETYCPIDPYDVPGLKFYSSSDKVTVSEKFKYKPKAKFAKKYLISQILDSDGNVSKPYVTTETMNTERYLNNCVKKILVPFINNRDVLFWPDMASCHYARPVVDYLRSKKIDFVEKKDNGPNVPQARPIEKLWELCKKEYRKRKTPAKSLNSFRQIWTYISKKVAKKSGRALMGSVRQKFSTLVGRGYLPLMMQNISRRMVNLKLIQN